jgi:FkbM family methyltransferase
MLAVALLPCYILGMEQQSYAQHGEDVRVAEFFGSGHKGVFVEVGANDPIMLSQTYLLEQLGWRGVLVEPLPQMARSLREKRPASIVVEAAVSDPGHVGTAYMEAPEGTDSLARLVFENNAEKSLPTVPVRTLDSILDEAGLTFVDFLSIDIEGNEVPALMGLSFERFRPALIIIEDHVYDLACHRFITGKGYRLVDRTGCNSWYLRRDLPWTLRSQSSFLARMRTFYFARSSSMLHHDTRVADFFGHDSKGVYVKVGANDPIHLSQTGMLEQLGWRGVLVEPLPQQARAPREKRPASIVVEAVASDSGHAGTAWLETSEGADSTTRVVFENNAQRSLPSVPVRTLDSILDENALKTVDFLSVDGGGNEISILQGLSLERFRPALIVIEDRVRDLSRHRFLTGKGYRLVDRTGCNGWYLRRDLAWTLRSHTSFLSRLRKYYLALPLRMLRHRNRK